jgi:hypothetical protein
MTHVLECLQLLKELNEHDYSIALAQLIEQAEIEVNLYCSNCTYQGN